jgi:pyruvate formate lyase activating enzyme
MCHNAELVLSPNSQVDLDCEVIGRFLERRVGKLTGVVISGGEPTLQSDLQAFVTWVRGLGYAVKIDTNGYRPDALRKLLETDAVDFIAMDVKAPPAKYPLLTGLDDVDIQRIEESLALLSSSDVTVEYRTTVVPKRLTMGDIETLACWLNARTGGRGTYVLQQFRGMNTLDPNLADASPLHVDVLREMADRAGHWLPDVKLRGV